MPHRTRLLLSLLPLALVALPSGAEAAPVLEWAEPRRLVPTTGSPGISFGDALSLDATTALIGSRTENTQGVPGGAAHVFERGPGGWLYQARLLPSAGAHHDSFGESVAVHGDAALVGAPGGDSDEEPEKPGAAYVFARTAGAWSEQARLLPEAGPWRRFGASVALGGDTAFVGGETLYVHDGLGTTMDGAVQVFTRSGATWSWQQTIRPDDTHGLFVSLGCSLALDGDTALLGAYRDSDQGVEAGSVHVFVRTGPTWTRQTRLLAPDGASHEHFGRDVSLSGDTALVGAPQELDQGVRSGAAYVFVRTNGSWGLQTRLTSPDAAPERRFGSHVSLHGDTAVVSSDAPDGTGGTVHVFVRSGETWTETTLTVNDGGRRLTSQDVEVATSGGRVLVGPAYSPGDTEHSTYLFETHLASGSPCSPSASPPCAAACIDGICADDPGSGGAAGGGSAGGSGTGATTGSGGASSAAGAAGAGASGGPSVAGVTSVEDGCSCRTTGERSDGGGALALAGLALVAGRRRRG